MKVFDWLRGVCGPFWFRPVKEEYRDYETMLLLEMVNLPFTRDIGRRFSAGVRKLDERSARLFVADCAERALAVWDGVLPSNLAARRAIDAARAYANGEIGADELGEAYDAAGAATVEMYGYGTTVIASSFASAVNAAYYAAAPSGEFFSLAPSALFHAQTGVSAFKLSAIDSERKWQLGRLREIARDGVGIRTMEKHDVQEEVQ